MRKKGIAVAGNMIVDMLYPIDGFPKPGELTTITADATRSTGGCLCNDILDLAALDPELPLTALGRVGEDEAGDFVLEKLRERPNISLAQIRRQGTTSYTLVMADEVSKQRSFYQCRGANADFCEADIDWDRLDVDMLHIGYILLLDALDAPDGEYGTKMARLLHTARQRGIKTSIDVVTEASERFGRIVSPALRYTDYCIINEVEAQATTGVRLTEGKRPAPPRGAAGSARQTQGTGRVHLGGHPLAGGRLWIGRKQRLRGSAQPEIASGLHQGFRGRGRRLLLRRALRRLEGAAACAGHRTGHGQRRLLAQPARRHRGHALLRGGAAPLPRTARRGIIARQTGRPEAAAHKRRQRLKALAFANRPHPVL